MRFSTLGSLLKMKSGIVHCNFLDSSGHVMSAGARNWRDQACTGVGSLSATTSY